MRLQFFIFILTVYFQHRQVPNRIR